MSATTPRVFSEAGTVGGRSATVGDRAGAEIEQSDFLAGDVTTDVTLEEPGGGTGQPAELSRTQGGVSDQVTRDLQDLSREAQRPEVRLDDAGARGSEQTFGVDTDNDGLTDAVVQLDQERATQSNVTGAEETLDPGGRQGGRGRSRTDVGPGQNTQTGPNVGSDVGVGPGQQPDTRVGQPVDQVPDQTVDVFSDSASINTPTFDNDFPGDPSRPDRGRNRRQRRRRIPDVPFPDLPGGNQPGQGRSGAFANDEIFPSNIASGRQAIQSLDSDDDGRIFDDDDDSGGFEGFGNPFSSSSSSGGLFGGSSSSGGFFGSDDSGGFGL